MAEIISRRTSCVQTGRLPSNANVDFNYIDICLRKFLTNQSNPYYNIYIMKWKKLKSKINEFIYGSISMAQAKNYTDEMVAQMTNDYTANPTRETVDQLAKQFGKTTRSIIAKLSREGVYVAQPRTTKTGEPVVSKAQFVSAIEAHFDIAMPTLVKSGKQDLQKLAEALGLEVTAS